MKWVSVVLLVAALFAFGMAATSCTSLPDRETVAKLNVLSAKVEALSGEVVAAAEFVDSVKNEIAGVIEKGKKGELSASEIAALLGTLNERLKQGEDHLKAVKAEYELTKKEVKDLSESGVPLWQILLWGALGVLETVTGVGFFKKKKEATQQKNWSDYLTAGIDIMTRALEKSSTAKEAKKRIALAQHDAIEASVMKLPITPPKEQPPPSG